ncbi:hypothetical protein [Nostoc sp. 'Peltigera membranacea cyanobiont' N6]|nr:hypothetical protein [Nostoc sp. 'Peltigera membranacea cyanobiont' N6]
MEVPSLDLKAPYLELEEECDAAYQRMMELSWYIIGRELAKYLVY